MLVAVRGGSLDCSQGYLGLYASVKLDMFESVEISRKDPRARSSVMFKSFAIRLQILSVWCTWVFSRPSAASAYTDSSTFRVVQ